MSRWSCWLEREPICNMCALTGPFEEIDAIFLRIKITRNYYFSCSVLVSAKPLLCVIIHLVAHYLGNNFPCQLCSLSIVEQSLGHGQFSFWFTDSPMANLGKIQTLKM